MKPSVLFFDCETSGLFSKTKSDTDHSQPHIVQLCALLHDGEGKVMHELNTLVRPEGWEIDKGASDVHGITQEQATRYGLKTATVVQLFLALAERADLLVAHNFEFDAKMIRRDVLWSGREMPAPMLTKKSYCTMHNSTEVCRLPGPYGFKWPKLQEAHQHVTGSAFAGAHDASADVKACAVVYYALQKMLNHAI